MMISKKQHFVKYPAGYASYSSGGMEFINAVAGAINTPDTHCRVGPTSGRSAATTG